MINNDNNYNNKEWSQHKIKSPLKRRWITYCLYNITVDTHNTVTYTLIINKQWITHYS